MVIISSVKILEISLIFSLFFGFLYTVVWIANPENKEHFWFSALYWGNACFAIARLSQFKDLGDLNTHILPKLVFSILIGLTWAVYQFIYAMGPKTLEPYKKMILACTLVLVFAITWSSDLVLTSQAFVRINMAGEAFTGVKPGVAFPVAVFILQGFMLLLLYEVVRMKQMETLDRQLMITGFALFLLLGVNDMLTILFNLEWIRLFDTAYLPIGFMYTFVQFNQYGRLNRSLEKEVVRRTQDLKLSNAVRQKTEERYKEIFEKGNDWIFIHDLEGVIKEENFRFKKDFSWPDGTLNLKEIVVDRYRHQVDPYLKIVRKQKFAKGVVSIKGNADEAVILEYQSILIQDPNGPLNEVRGTARDITNEIKVIKEKKQLQDHLRQSQKMESIGTLAGGVAHDFNNILSMIIGNTELALQKLGSTHPASDYIHDIKTASGQAAGIIRQLLNFSRKSDLELKPIDAIQTVEESLTLLRSGIPSSIRIKTDFPKTPISIMADAIQLNRLMLNLGTNAAQAMSADGGVLEIQADTVLVSESFKSPHPELKKGVYLSLKVKDNGPGIRKEDLDRVFDPYFTTKAVGKGSGLGLSVVHGIVSSHHGAITVDSQLNQGTCFTILLPCTDQFAKETSSDKEHLIKGNETLLFIDDEPNLVKITGRILESMGYNVHKYRAAKTALEAFRADPDAFDMVITDMTMPEMTGLELFKHIRDIRPEMPVILCTGHSNLVNKTQALEMGITGYLTKPFSMAHLGELIRNIFDADNLSVPDQDQTEP